MGDTIRGPTGLHHLAKHGAQQKNNEPVPKEGSKAGHVTDRKVWPSLRHGRHQGNATKERHQQGTERGGNQNIHAPDGEYDKQYKPANQPDGA